MGDHTSLVKWAARYLAPQCERYRNDAYFAEKIAPEIPCST